MGQKKAHAHAPCNPVYANVSITAARLVTNLEKRTKKKGYMQHAMDARKIANGFVFKFSSEGEPRREMTTAPVTVRATLKFFNMVQESPKMVMERKYVTTIEICMMHELILPSIPPSDQVYATVAMQSISIHRLFEL